MYLGYQIRISYNIVEHGRQYVTIDWYSNMKLPAIAIYNWKHTLTAHLCRNAKHKYQYWQTKSTSKRNLKNRKVFNPQEVSHICRWSWQREREKEKVKLPMKFSIKVWTKHDIVHYHLISVHTVSTHACTHAQMELPLVNNCKWLALFKKLLCQHPRLSSYQKLWVRIWRELHLKWVSVLAATVPACPSRYLTSGCHQKKTAWPHRLAGVGSWARNGFPFS